MYPDLNPPERLDEDEHDILDMADIAYEEWRDKQNIDYEEVL